MNDDDLSVTDAAARLGVHTNTIRNWCATGRLRAQRLHGDNGYLRIPVAEVERIESQRKQAMSVASNPQEHDPRWHQAKMLGIAANTIESAASIASGQGEYGLANHLWAFEETLRSRARTLRVAVHTDIQAAKGEQ